MNGRRFFARPILRSTFLFIPSEFHRPFIVLIFIGVELIGIKSILYHYIFYFYQPSSWFNQVIHMNRIKEVLAQKGIKQTWLADKLGKSFNMVNSYAQNRRQPPIEVLYRIADLLDVDVRDLLIDNKKNNSAN